MKKDELNLTKYVYAYTRAQALSDGVLIDVSKIAREAGFKIPVAVTSVVWDAYVEWTEADTKRQTVQDTEGRLWDLLYMLSLKIKRNRDAAQSDYIFFEFLVVPRGGRGRKARLTRLKALIGPGDNFEPVLTILLLNED